MAKRSKELFELLAQRGNAAGEDSESKPEKKRGRAPTSPKGAAGTSAKTSKDRKRSTAKKAVSKRTSEGKAGSKPRTDDHAEDPAPRTGALRGWLGSRGGDETVADAPMGQRRVNVSLNLLLFFVAAFVLTNIMSYMVGSMRRGDAAVDYGPLSVPLDQYWTIQVTRPLPKSEWKFAWDIQEILEREGYRDAQVSRLRIDGADWYRTIVGRGQSRGSLEPLKRQLDVTLSKLTDLGSITTDPRLETALVRQQEERAWRTEQE